MDVYLKIYGAYINIMWSTNGTEDEDAIGAIGIYVYDRYGNEHETIEGGEMDVYEDKELTDYIPDILEFIGFKKDKKYTIISEEQFDNIFY